MKYKISDKRKDFLREKFFEYSFKNMELDIVTLDQITEPIELDFIAKNHNYDDGNEILEYIIKNPNCDFSTVKMIFFRADLESFLEGRKQAEDYELISLIVQKYSNTKEIVENFYYDRNEDVEVSEFNIKLSENTFPAALFSKGRGKKLEPNFAQNFHRRSIKTLTKAIEIKKELQRIEIKSKNVKFEFIYPESFRIIHCCEIENFISNFKFPKNLQNTFGITDKQLKKVIIKPESVIISDSLIIIFFVFNAYSLFLENALTNVVTMMRNEFTYIQAFLRITMVEEKF